MNKNIELKIKVQIIYYQDSGGNLGTQVTTLGTKRVTIKEAEQLLIDREIDYKEVLKVKYEYIYLSLTPEQLESFIVL